MDIKVCIFDAYGTLFDVAAAARRLADGPTGAALRPVWAELARDWRQKQLQYTWLRAVAGQHQDFWSLTADALDWALEAHNIESPALRADLLGLYWELEAFAEVPTVLAALKTRGLRCAILSNGTPQMLEAAVNCAGISASLDAVLSVEDVGIFKPAPRVYDMVSKRFECSAKEVLFVSSNGWDAAAAAGYGFNTAWVNRAGEPVDRLWAKPQVILNDLNGIEGLL
ncbi:MAG: haloacid dehalogenase type II [Rhodobacteraceae bacterium]|nr:haloacid dehalogenase type II [Paracoccaceae bacterium]